MEPNESAQKLGPYQLGLLLGEGGMGEVYKAFDDRLGRWVAVKRIRGEAGDTAKARFRREARTLAQLGHPGIVQIFDWLQDDDGDWIVMELIDGPTLAELRRSGPLLPTLVVDYGRQIASALAAAHGSGVVHRDLKSENVMVLPSGHVKVLDFGLARHLNGTPAHGHPERTDPHHSIALKSKAGRIVGTPRAMSPEQALGREVDARTDLFSLGVLLYELLTSRSPFAARNTGETLRRVVEHHPPTTRRLNPMVPRALSQLVDRLLEKESAHRPATATEVEASLQAMASGDPLLSAVGDGLSQIATIDGSAVGNDSGPSVMGASMSSGPNHDTVVVTTLLVSDLVGSTRLVEELGDRRAASLFQRHDRLARDLMHEHGGREIDKTDGFLLLFERTWSAVAYALAYHRVLADLELKARVGIHLGEVVLHRNLESDVRRGAKPLEVEGLAKPTAARLMSLAVGGQTLLTRAAYEVARRSSMDGWHVDDLQWPDHGRYRFQGLAEAVEVFEVGSPERAPLIRPSGSKKVHRVVELPPAEPLRAAVTLRAQPTADLPEHPYPVLLPYHHPDLLKGRDAEISKLRRLLETQVPILGLSAPSGTGKSSLLLAGLVPRLRAAGVPVAVARHPAEAGLGASLIGDLLDGADPPDDLDARAFVDRLTEVEGLAGKPPVLVLDPFEDVLRPEATAARRTLGLLMATSLTRRAGRSSAPCRWLLAYRQEFDGRLRAWLRDVLREARAADVDAADSPVGSLPHDLSAPERFQRLALTPLATPPPRSEDPLRTSTETLLSAIETPLSLKHGDQGPRFPWFFAAGDAERLARAFAEARLARPDAPLAPELQVVLAHVLSHADPDGRLHVPEDVGPLIEQALDQHLRRALEQAFPIDRPDSATRRARALLALRELATSTGRREEGLSAEQLSRAIGNDGQAVLEQLSTPLTRLVWVREASDGLRWTLSHDRLAEAVVRLVDEQDRQGRLVIDDELLALRRFVTLRTELFRTGRKEGRQSEASTQISGHRFRKIHENAETLLWNEEKQAWFTACKARRRADRRRAATVGSVALLLLISIAAGTWAWTERNAERRAWREQVTRAEPKEAFQAVRRLSDETKPEGSQVFPLIQTRSAPMDILEWALVELEGRARNEAVLSMVELLLPLTEASPEDPMVIAGLIWALDFGPCRDPELVAQAQDLRRRALEPLWQIRPPPQPSESGDPDWIEVPSGRFLMGSAPNESGRSEERPQHEVTISGFRMLRHEVTVEQYRRLVPQHRPSSQADLPASFVSWFEAYTYAAWLGGRLPTEAEWEYAARADCEVDPCGSDGRAATLEQVAWTATSESSDPKAVMQLEPNPWGFYDMLGNVWEWTTDAFAEYPQTPRQDPWSSPPIPQNGRRVTRGGAFNYEAAASRVASRQDILMDNVSGGIGFRVVAPACPEQASQSFN